MLTLMLMLMLMPTLTLMLLRMLILMLILMCLAWILAKAATANPPAGKRGKAVICGRRRKRQVSSGISGTTHGGWVAGRNQVLGPRQGWSEAADRKDERQTRQCDALKHACSSAPASS
jgi:hypothetical protein